MTKTKPNPPPKDACRCKAFCIEDTRQTGRYCQMAHRLAGNLANGARNIETEHFYYDAATRTLIEK